MAAHLPPAPVLPLAPPVQGGEQGAAVEEAPLIALSEVNGTVSKWLVQNATYSQGDALMTVALRNELSTAFGQYEDIANLDAAETAEFYSNLSHDILSSHEFNGFLAVIQEDDQAKVVVLHTLRRYAVGIGASAQFSGRTFGFLGDCRGDQMPQLVILPENTGLTSILTVASFMIPSEESIAAFIANPLRSGLVPGPTANAANAELADLSTLVFCPRLWAAHFMVPVPLFQAYATLKALILQQGDAAVTNVASPLVDWFWHAMCRHGNAPRTRPISRARFNAVAPVVNAQVTYWAAASIAPFIFRPAVTPVPLQAVPIQALPEGGGHGQKENSKAVFSQTELEYLERVCCVEINQDDVVLQGDGILTYLPRIYGLIASEGKKKDRVRRLLSQETSSLPRNAYQIPVNVAISEDLVQDVISLRFAYNDDDLSYINCHRGLTPFTVPQLTIEQRIKRRRLDSLLNRASHVSVADLEASETTPAATPGTYDSTIKQIAAYAALAEALVGTQCDHLIKVNAIRRYLILEQAQLSTLTATECAALLWAIFLDSRQFFREGYNPNVLPRSNLGTTLTMLMSGTIVAARSMPASQLLGGRSDATEQPSHNPQPSAAQPGNHTMVVPPAIATVIATIKARQRHCSALTLLERADAAALTLGPPRSCMQLRLFGKGQASDCGYRHGKSPPTEANITKVVSTLKAIALALTAGPSPCSAPSSAPTNPVP